MDDGMQDQVGAPVSRSLRPPRKIQKFQKMWSLALVFTALGLAGIPPGIWRFRSASHPPTRPRDSWRNPIAQWERIWEFSIRPEQ